MFSIGFLLDDNNRQNSSVNLQGQYLTMEDKIQLNHDIEKVRNELKGDINLLTSQLKTRLVSIGEQFAKYNSTKIVNDTSHLQIMELETNITKLTQSLDTLKQENAELKVQLSITKNETDDLNRKLKSLQELKNIQQLQSMATLQEKVRVVDSSVNSLLSHEQARNQDFLALYNITIQSKNQLANFQKLASDRLLTLETGESFQNKTITDLQEQVDKNAKKVAVTGCFTDGKIQVSRGHIIQFPTIKYSDGITHLESFKLSGKFTCDVPGLYHISAVIMSGTLNANFYIYKNGVQMTWLYVSNNSRKEYYSGTSVIALDLQVGDTLWVQTGATMEVFGPYSCLTIIKVK